MADERFTFVTRPDRPCAGTAVSRSGSVGSARAEIARPSCEHRIRTMVSTHIFVVAVLIFASTTIVCRHGFAAAELPRVDFNQHVRPILSNHCWKCHGPDEAARKAGLRLDQRESATGKTENDLIAIVPGKPELSELVSRIQSHDSDVMMPPASTNKPLSDDQKQTLILWIEQGAEYSQHWAFVLLQRPEVPPVVQTDWPQNEVDRFVLKQQEQHGLKPTMEAGPSVWLRRVTLDLTGLPPTPQDLDELMAALETGVPSDVYGSVVDRLLAAPAHAERMAMLWLDAARYADTNGYNNDEARTMWPWRDWVIHAFADDMPYDQFLTEQLAGDLLPDASVSQKVATGFNRNHVLTTEGGIIEEEYHVEYVADRIHTTATVFMAMSMQCARCHDHKFDPILQRQYYQFAAFFNNIPDKVVGYSQGKMADPTLLLATPEQQTELDRLEQRIAELQKLTRAESATSPVVEGTVPSTEAAEKELEQLTRQREELDKSIPRTMIMAEQPEPRATFILKRGAYDQRAEQVDAALPITIFDAGVSRPSIPAAPVSVPLHPASRLTRLDLARWLADPAHPLTSRVAVNRLWEMLFGTGLVETTEDFGAQGAQPSHPELLDWLATELIRNNWSQRAMLKKIVMSATYRQSSRVSQELLERDPRNRLLSRGPRFRLSAETVRDNALFVSGLLAARVGGPSVKPYQPDGLWEDVSVERREKYVADSGDGLYRRSMYTFWKRTCPPPGMSTFDAPDRESCVIRRSRTNTPLQALVLLNDPTYIEAARKLAERVCIAAESDDERIRLAFRIVLARTPDAEELATVEQAVESAREHFAAHPEAIDPLLSIGASPRSDRIPPAEQAAWTTSMSMLLNLDETISKP